jgi:hypothetical protein
VVVEQTQDLSRSAHIERPSSLWVDLYRQSPRLDQYGGGASAPEDWWAGVGVVGRYWRGGPVLAWWAGIGVVGVVGVVGAVGVVGVIGGVGVAAIFECRQV